MKASYVAQEQENGCTAAAVAMVVGKSYDEVQRLAYVNFNDKGMSLQDWFPYLFEQHGFVAHTMYSVTQLTGLNEKREVWPPLPFAPIHLCTVTTVKGSHAVVMLDDGVVLDPAVAEPRRLKDYVSVSAVYGLFRVK